jgi:pimeloyl-ACP methyl ester carboxylesterase
VSEVFKEVGHFESFDGTSIYFERHGEGEPLVLIYGICCLINHWHFQVDYFSKSRQVIVFDIRGHHQSGMPRDKSNLSIHSVAKDVEALLNHLNLRQADLAGHSFGVPVLIEFAALFPERTKSLTFINGFAQNPIKGMFGLDVIEPIYNFIKNQYALAPKLWTEVWKVAVNNPLAMWITGIAGGFNLRLTQFKDIEIYTQGVAHMDLGVTLPFFEDLMRFEGNEMLKEIQSPTLIISGDHDAVTPFKFQEQMHALVRHSELLKVPYGSHCTQLDFPDYVNLKIDSHLKAQGSD